MFNSRSRDKDEKDSGANLSQNERLQLIKQSKAFQKAEKHLMLKSTTTKILYHHLACELFIEAGNLE